MQLFRILAMGSSALLLGACSGDDSQSYPGGAGGTITTSSTSNGGSGAAGGSASGGADGGAAVTGGGGAGVAGGGGAGVAGGGGTGGAGPVGCQWSADDDSCAPGGYCNAPGCGAGVCTPLSATEDSQEQPVCGCDGVSYWNATIAAVHGAAVRAAGACTQPHQASCGGLIYHPCPNEARQYCDHGRDDQVGCGGADMPGVCWAMPTQCPLIMFSQERQCVSLGGTCLNRCEAIKDETPYFHDQSCPT
jgi:hypothetical protein